MTFEKLRDDLPVTRNVDYFQVGSHGPTPDSVLDVVREEMALEAHYHSVPSVKAEQAGRRPRPGPASRRSSGPASTRSP